MANFTDVFYSTTASKQNDHQRKITSSKTYTHKNKSSGPLIVYIKVIKTGAQKCCISIDRINRCVFENVKVNTCVSGAANVFISL